MGILQGKIALITGTGGGLGRAAAQAFAREGAKVIGCDINAAANEETVELVRRASGEMNGLAPVDLTDPEQARRMVEDAVSVHGGLDVIYNNAAVQRFGPMPEFSLEDWRATIAGELDIPFFVSKFAWPHLVQRGGGVIINIASLAGMIAGQSPPMVGHAAAKGGVIAMTRQLALEGAANGIRAVAISPGPFLTPASERDLGDNQDLRDAITRKTLLKRFGQPQELVELAAFIASDRAGYITGQTLLLMGALPPGSTWRPVICVSASKRHRKTCLNQAVSPHSLCNKRPLWFYERSNVRTQERSLRPLRRPRR